MRGFAGKIAGVGSTIPFGPVIESDLLKTGKRHGHDVAVAALLAPFADSMCAPVAADLGLREGTRCAGSKVLVCRWGIEGRHAWRAGRESGRSCLLNFCSLEVGL